MLFPCPTLILKTPTFQPRWTSWIRIAFIVPCAAALLIYLYRKLALTSTSYQLIIPESHDNGDFGPAFTVRDLPGRGKGMIAVRDIRVSTIPCFWKPTLRVLLRSAGRAIDSGTTADCGSSFKYVSHRHIHIIQTHGSITAQLAPRLPN
jgi:hypothetical protein